MRVILDTNVFMSGLFWGGSPGEILDAWGSKFLTIVFSKNILTEYLRVSDELSKKYRQIDIAPFINLLTIHGELHEPKKLSISISRDPDDDKFIALAISANCPCIISGDKDLLVLNEFHGIEILKPGDFVRKYLETH